MRVVYQNRKTQKRATPKIKRKTFISGEMYYLDETPVFFLDYEGILTIQGEGFKKLGIQVQYMNNEKIEVFE